MDRTDAGRRHRGGDDSGFTLIEVLVAVAIISVVMLGLGAAFIATAAGTDAQGLRQNAARLATDGLDRVHALSGAAVLKGRDQTSVTTQWATRPTGVNGLLAGLTPLADTTAGPGSATADCAKVATGTACANLPTSSASTVDKIVYTQSFYVAGCQLTAAGTCLAKVGTGTVPMYDVVVSVGWRDKSCANNSCTYQLSTLIAANTADPLFNTNTFKVVGPTLRAVTDQVQDVTESVTGPTVSFDGGNGAVTLVATGLPPGVTLDPTTGVFSSTGPLTGVSPATTVKVTATDRFNLFSTTTFTWTVNALPTLTSAALPLVTGLTTTLDLASVLKLTGGTTAFTWNCTGLPTGLVLDKTTGIVTGATAVLGLSTSSCTVTDARGKNSTATLSLTAAAPLVITAPADGATATVYRVLGVTTTAVATGCTGACTWSAVNLPGGLTLTPASGLVTGKPVLAGTYRIVFTVRDTAGRTASSTVSWRVI